MTAYKNLSGESGVTAYTYGPGYIRIRFIDGEIYKYTNASTGKKNIQEMQALADAGKGLSTFISRYVREKYAHREEHHLPRGSQ